MDMAAWLLRRPNHRSVAASGSAGSLGDGNAVSLPLSTRASSDLMCVPTLPVFAVDHSLAALSGSTQPTEVGVLEVVVVLQAIAHESVHTDVGEPDESQGQGKGVVLPPSERDDHSC